VNVAYAGVVMPSLLQRLRLLLLLLLLLIAGVGGSVLVASSGPDDGGVIGAAPLVGSCAEPGLDVLVSRTSMIFCVHEGNRFGCRFRVQLNDNRRYEGWLHDTVR
jgi:hypothetical protein